MSYNHRVFRLIVPCPSNAQVKRKGVREGKEGYEIQLTIQRPRDEASSANTGTERDAKSRQQAGSHPRKCPGRPSKIQDANADVFGLVSRDFSKTPMIETRHRTNDWSSSEKPAIAGGVEGSFLLPVYYKEWRYKM